MALQSFLHETQRGSLVPGFRNLALQHLALVIDRSPQIHHLSVDPHVHLVEVPLPVPKSAHSADPLTTDFSNEKGPEAVPPLPHGIMADIDAAIEQEILDVPQAQRKLDIHQNNQLLTPFAMAAAALRSRMTPATLGWRSPVRAE
jgi:hypothetical protein